MTNSTRALLITTTVALSGLMMVNLMFGRYAQNHFVPAATLRQAELAGDRCIVTMGDSRMAAGIDPPALSAALQARGVQPCVAQLALGAVPVSGEAMTLRRFVADAHTPGYVIFGASTGTLLPEDPPDPSSFVGNRTVELAWSYQSDTRIYYPDFPIGELDRGVRFTLERTNALTTYQSLVWAKTQHLQDRIVGTAHDEPRNRFGSIADMHALLGAFQRDAIRALSQWDGHWQLSQWFQMLRNATHAAGAQLVVLEVPMHSSYRHDVLDLPVAIRYRHWLREELARMGDSFVDVSAPASVTDADFADGLHLDESGARSFSKDLGAAIRVRTVPGD